MIYETIIYEKLGNIGIITLNRADKMNTLIPCFITEFADVINVAGDDPDVRAVVIKSTGKVFSAGGDFESLKGFHQIIIAKKAIAQSGDFVQKIYNMPKPVICAVQGPAVGAGSSIALSCDFVIASEKASFTQSFVNIGLIPDSGGMWSLARLVGITKAKELAMTARTVNAQEALNYGMVLKVVAEDKLEQETIAFAKKLADKPPFAIANIKYLANKLHEVNMSIFFELEANLMGMALQTKDHQEGLAAFLEKRKPLFTGE